MGKPNGREEYGVASLRRKREQIVAEIGEKEIALQNLVAQLTHIDAALCILRPEISLPAPPKHDVQRRRPSQRGAVSRPVLLALRQAPEPLTVKDLARAMLVAQGKPALRVSEDAKETVRAVLRALKKKGAVRERGFKGRLRTWELIRDP